ncbi:hypothetical protein [Terriglobus tenax]|uniref:hypothetical protein n=1 Tax=Terriglobus tenax TaxID=1111115 RepID=UPI0021DF7356|nr:hypothetical protein [Terriglobus tenax]
MKTRRPLLLTGFGLAVRHWRAVVWTYALQLLLTVLFAWGLTHQLSSLLAHSLASARLSSGFDLVVLLEAMKRVNQFPNAGPQQFLLSSLLFALLYLILTPGTLYAYLTGERACLHRLLFQGFRMFWRFAFLALAAGIGFAVVLGPLSAIRTAINNHLDAASFFGKPGFLVSMTMLAVLLLVACVLRLYFDLVEVYAVRARLTEPGSHGAFFPALRLLRSRFWGPYLSFALLTFGGIGTIALAAWFAVHRLAAPHAFGIFVLLQSGIFVDLFTRFWQRGMEVTLVEDAVEPEPVIEPISSPDAPFYPPEENSVFEG